VIKARTWYALVLIVLVFVVSCTRKGEPVKLFTLVSSSHTHVDFINELKESADFNIIEYLYYYNGGGVSIGDINNDGLADIYFSGNQVSNKLYLNKGNLEFEDITLKAGVQADGNWKTGVSMVDVNADGYLDIFVCGVGNYKKFNGYNQLFINNGDLTFREAAKEVGLAFQGFSTQACFFDFDLDGDLDMYLLNHSVHTQRSYGKVSLRYESDSLAGDILYQNQLVERGELKFVDVSEQAGILQSQIGYGLGIGVGDINRDGYPDIYVSNDFAENDYVYINQQDGTFQQQAEQAMSHTSRFSMGNDVADINNDLWPDVITLDMLPRQESVIKTSAGEDSYEVYSFKLKYGYHKQVSRNSLQINLGAVDEGKVFFQDVAAAVGLAATDWSWGPYIVDFDGDGLKDVFISNGIVRRPNDLDYINFISSDSVQQNINSLEWINKMPDGKVSNFIFKNEGDLSFSDQTSNWGLNIPSYSNGAAVGDLDNDGDPDLVVNRINEEVLIYKNNSSQNRFVKVRLNAPHLLGNRNAVGAKVLLTQGNHTQIQDFFPTRGWCSSSDYSLIFGLSDSKKPFQLEVVWPDQQKTALESTDRDVFIKYEGQGNLRDKVNDLRERPLLNEVDAIEFVHRENEFNAFSRESLIPFMLSQEGPALAHGDVNSDGLDDIYVGGAKQQSGSLFVQNHDGSFTKKQPALFQNYSEREEVDAAFFDADKDGDLDLVTVAAGQEDIVASEAIQPMLFVNNGGIFEVAPKAFLGIFLQASCIRPADYDLDGDIDLFIGSSVMPMLYGMSPVSYLLANDGTGHFYHQPNWLGSSKFNNPTGSRPGMVKDAVWCKLDEDNLPDLVLVGEWMPITILLQSADHTFQNATDRFGLSNTRGLWNAIACGDVDDDGDFDLIGGNFGWNSRLKASVQKPLSLYLGDFDSNGGSDHILVYFNGEKSYPFPSRDQLVKQIPSLRKKFLAYQNYRDVELSDIVTPQQQGNSAVLIADNLSSALFLNNGDKFIEKTLPLACQLFPVYDILIANLDSQPDNEIVLVGNNVMMQPEIGPLDAGVGLVLKKSSNQDYVPIPPSQSGFFIKGEGRNIRKVKTKVGNYIVVARNNGSVLSFRSNNDRY